MEQQLIEGLKARGVPQTQAIGIVANMIAESGLNPGINEISPTVAGSRGGYGLNQWTGPRRRQFEAFAKDRGASLSDVDTQLDFTVWELANTEKAAGSALASTKTPEEAARVYSERFLRPGIPHLDSRLSHARRLSGGGQGNALAAQPQQQFGQPQGEPQANALAPPKMADMRQDPRAFMRQGNRLAMTPFEVPEYANPLARNI